MMLPLVAAAAALLLACAPARSAATPPRDEGQPGPAAPVDAGTASHSKAVDPCAARLAEYDAALASASGRCAADADCACYSDIRRDNEMGVSDKITAAKLQQLADAYRKQTCPTICVQVLPVKCRPRCSAGTCKAP